LLQGKVEAAVATTQHTHGEEDMSKMLCHSDSESGTTILNDGTHVYWTAGASEAVIVRGDHREVVDAQSDHPILLTPEVAENEVDESRMMTAEEEAEWEAARR